uniref:MULE transposase domain-containing protein n=1 Tax=Strigamia maritima TaxID=126957 RepID=T1J1B2_STRMM
MYRTFVTIDSTRKSSHLYYDESCFLWRKNKISANGTYLSCWRKAKVEDNCSAAAFIPAETPNMLIQRSVHDHGPDDIECKKMLAISKMKQKVATESTSKREVYDNVIASTPRAIARLITYPRVESTLNRVQARDKPKAPQPIEEFWSTLQMPEIQTKFLEGLQRSGFHMGQTYHMDGTFKTCPPFFQQLFTIHLNYRGHAFPLLYSLMTSKSNNSYIRLFQFIKTVIHDGSPRVISDYKLGILSVVSQELRLSQHQGCWFHFCKALRLHMMQQDHLSGLISGNDCHLPLSATIIKVLKMTMALALLPVNRITDGLRQIEAAFRLRAQNYSRDVQEQMNTFFAYVCTYWIDQIRPERFCVYKQPDRTNNRQENFRCTFGMTALPVMSHWMLKKL